MKRQYPEVWIMIYQIFKKMNLIKNQGLCKVVRVLHFGDRGVDGGVDGSGGREW